MKYIFLVGLVTAAIFERILFDLGPNIELVTVLMLLSSFYFGQKEGIWAILVVMVISDLVLGNSNIFVFTWSGFLIPAVVLGKLLKGRKLSSISRVFTGSFSGILSTLFFYIWTNFGVWALDSWNMYPNTLNGLVNSYVNGIPFLKYQTLSTILLVPTGFVLSEALLAIKTYFLQLPKRVFPT